MCTRLITFMDIGAHEAYARMREHEISVYLEDKPSHIAATFVPRFAPNVFHSFCHAYLKALNEELETTDIEFIQTNRDALNFMDTKLEIAMSAKTHAHVISVVMDSPLEIQQDYDQRIHNTYKKLSEGYFPFFASIEEFLQSPKSTACAVEALLIANGNTPLFSKVMDNSNVREFQGLIITEGA